MNIVGEKIKEKREKMGLSQEELAKKIGYRSRSTIAKIEKGQIDIGQSKVSKFASALECSIEDILGLEIKDKPITQGDGLNKKALEFYISFIENGINPDILTDADKRAVAALFNALHKEKD